MGTCEAIHAVHPFLQHGSVREHEVFERFQCRNGHRFPCLSTNRRGLFGCDVSWKRMAFSSLLGWPRDVGYWRLWVRLLRRRLSNPRIPRILLAFALYYYHFIGDGIREKDCQKCPPQNSKWTSNIHKSDWLCSNAHVGKYWWRILEILGFLLVTRKRETQSCQHSSASNWKHCWNRDRLQRLVVSRTRLGYEFYFDWCYEQMFDCYSE
mmetsp:Transcript_19216/g.39466  ORF Transcript_19216/g.39466 Transcript_19216/m.39466 type:complete len:209 (-) Transcript_19216:1765-2391(-)